MKRGRYPSFTLTRPEDVSQLSAYYQARREWAAECNAMDAGVAFEDRPLASLKRECLARGIRCSGTKDDMILRIREYDRGNAVVTVDFAGVEPPVRRVGIELHRPMAPAWGNGLTSLPHDVIRVYIIRRHLPWRDWIYLALTCRYLMADALLEMTDLAQQWFGPGGTPMALTLYR